MRLKLIHCFELSAEIAIVIARTPNDVETECLGERMDRMDDGDRRRRLQAALEKVDPVKYHAVLLGCGVAGNELVGLEANALPVVIPRGRTNALPFLRSGGEGLDHLERKGGFQRQNGAWNTSRRMDTEFGRRFREIQRGRNLSQRRAGEASRIGTSRSIDSLFRTGRRWASPTAFIWMGVSAIDCSQRQEHAKPARRRVRWPSFEGGNSWLQRFVDGYWSYDEFLVVPRGWRVVTKPEGNMIAAEESPG